MSKSPDAFRTISEVAEWLGVQAHVLRFWESKFSQVKPVKRAGGRRYYRPADMQLLGGIRKLLHEDGLTIKGVQKILREQGVAKVSSFSKPLGNEAEDDLEANVDNTVVRFKGRTQTSEPADADWTPTTVPEVESEPELNLGPATEKEDVPAVAEAKNQPTPEPEPEPAVAAPPPESESPRLPSFLHRGVPAPRDSEYEEIDTPRQKRARVIDAPDPPADDELPVRAGVLSRLAALDELGPEQVAALVPLAADLRTWLDRSGGARAS